MRRNSTHLLKYSKIQPNPRSNADSIINSEPAGTTSFHGLPEVVRIKEPRELGININYVHIAFLVIPDDCFVVVSSMIRFSINA